MSIASDVAHKEFVIPLMTVDANLTALYCEHINTIAMHLHINHKISLNNNQCEIHTDKVASSQRFSNTFLERMS